MGKIIKNCMFCLVFMAFLSGCAKDDSAPVGQVSSSSLSSSNISSSSVSEPSVSGPSVSGPSVSGSSISAPSISASSISASSVPASENTEVKTVAISMPTQSDEKWINAAAAIETDLEEAGCQVLVEFAEDDAKQQISQIETFMDQEVDCLIVAPIPSADLADALDDAKAKDITIISYDRLVMGTEAVDYYAGFDNLEAGRQIGQYIIQEKRLGQEPASQKDLPVSYTIEFFTGDPQDYSAQMVHKGILEILQPYLDAGILVCKSGRIKFEDTAILYESQDTAQKNCEALLDANYLDGHLDIACTTSDTLAYGVRSALENREYTQGESWPLVTGQNAQLAAVSDIIDGYQSMTIFQDTRELADQCAKMAIACLKGKKPVTNDRKHYKNGSKTVPAYLVDTQAVDKENYKKVLLDSGYYTESQLP